MRRYGYTCAMSLHLVLPGLLWPASAPAPAPRTPSLSRLIARGRLIRRAAVAPESALAALFGLDGTAPLAALRRVGCGAAPDLRHWLAADATHLRFARDALLLTDAPDVAPDAAEAAALAASWNAHFTDVGWLELGAGGQGHIALARPVQALTTPPGAAIGRKIDARLPEGPDGAQLRQWMNETQMLLHAHPVNAAREEAGRPPINNLWFWGAGALPVRAHAPGLQMWSDNALAHGLATAAGVRAAPLPPQPSVAMQPGNVVLIDDALSPSLYLDHESWTRAVEAVDAQWIAPAAQALRSGEIRTLTLTLGGDDAQIEVTVRRADLMKFWRPARPLIPGPGA
jgi:hypothetical protein